MHFKSVSGNLNISTLALVTIYNKFVLMDLKQ